MAQRTINIGAIANDGTGDPLRTAFDNINKNFTDNYTSIAGTELTSRKGAANGYAGLDSGGKVPVSQLPNSIMEYQGLYNASTNTPTLVDGTGNTGDVWKASVAGAGVNSLNFVVGDYAVYNGSTWEKSHSGADNVTTVFGRSGAVAATSGDYNTSQVTEVTNLYFTVARVLATALTGFSTVTGGAVIATDTVLAAFGKIQNQLNAIASTYLTISRPAYSFPVNNTNGTANATNAVYTAKSIQTYSGTVTWTGSTAASGSTAHSYNWAQIGNLVTLTIDLAYAVASSNTTLVSLTLPADCPAPVSPTGRFGASNILYPASGHLLSAGNSASLISPFSALRVNAAATGYEIFIAQSSINCIWASVTVQYFTS